MAPKTIQLWGSFSSSTLSEDEVFEIPPNLAGYVIYNEILIQYFYLQNQKDDISIILFRKVESLQLIAAKFLKSARQFHYVNTT